MIKNIRLADPAYQAEWQALYEWCAKNQHGDRKHSWRFDGDDPYLLCVYCGERREALTSEAVPRRLTPECTCGAADRNSIVHKFSCSLSRAVLRPPTPEGGAEGGR